MISESERREPGEPIAGDLHTLNRRATRWAWTIAIAEVVLCGGCATLFALLARTPLKELLEQAKTQTQKEQLAQAHPLFTAHAISVFVLGFLPGLALLWLGFSIRAGKNLQTKVAIGLTIMQTVVLGVFLASLIAHAILTSTPKQLTLVVIMLGTPMALLIYAIRALMCAQQHQVDTVALETDPW